MAGLKKRKFSFDIPRLKIGPSKSDTKVLRDHLLTAQLDSPPPTPKSVRPPLSPYTEAELRSACAYVLQNFKPSHIVYEEQYGSSQAKPQLDYAAIKGGPVAKPKQAVALPIRKVTVQEQESAIEADDDVESVTSEKFRYKPKVATEDLFVQEEDPSAHALSVAALRAEQLMAPQRSKTISIGPKQRQGKHSRSASNPIRGMALTASAPAPAPAPRLVPAERPRVERTASAGTTGSTPETDTTDYPWSEKASTAMTSAVLTPARSSKRTSSQAVASGSESSSAPKVEAVDADWMRQELEKHKKAHEARVQQGQELALEEAASSTVASETTPKQAMTEATTPVKVKVPSRKPVPESRSSSRQENLPLRTDSSQSVEQVVAAAKPALDVPVANVHRSASKRVAETPRPESRQNRQQEREPHRGRSRSISRGVKEYFKPTPPTDKAQIEAGASRGLSRSGSVTRHVKEYFRPSTSSRKPSMDLGGRTESRGRSIDSFRSTFSQKPPSDTSTTSKFKAFKTYHRGRKSESSPETSRPGSSSSNADARGRGSARGDGSPQLQRAKPTVNLNRDLPPLPSLDSWKSNSRAATPISGSRLVSPAVEKADPLMSPRSQISQNSKPEWQTVNHHHALAEQAEILAARMGSPSATRARNSKSSADLRVVPPPPQPTAPPPAPPTLSATISSFDDLAYDHLAPTTSIDPIAAQEAKKDRRRSKSIQNIQSAVRPDKPQHSSSAPRINTTKTPLTGKAQLVNTIRTVPTANTAGGPPNFNLFRSPSKAVRPTAAATTNHPPTTHHSRTSSQSHSQPQQRKFSMDDYAAATRTIDPRYQNTVEISATPTSASQRALSPANANGQTPSGRDKTKQKWWQRKDKKDGAGGWMDQVLKSGSSSGILLQDEVAGAPIVRY